MKKQYIDSSRRNFFKSIVFGGTIFLFPKVVLSGAQKEEYLADSVASNMGRSLNNVNPARLIFSSDMAGQLWLNDMNKRLSQYVDYEYQRHKILINLQYEASRAGLDSQLILGLIQIESRFRRYAISPVGARGLMQVMPFWVSAIGKPEHNLFDIRTNLRYGCTILRYYLDRENGNLFRALGRYNGSLGKASYPNAVLGAMQQNWVYNGPV
ncbi:MAG: transglycosylase SLT domain-containing protein [Neisseriaceae bacterium]|nr:MAG: transglycosylase SLT domain-containing protein [Neisseriaceae bacterium]